MQQPAPADDDDGSRSAGSVASGGAVGLRAPTLAAVISRYTAAWNAPPEEPAPPASPALVPLPAFLAARAMAGPGARAPSPLTDDGGAASGAAGAAGAAAAAAPLPPPPPAALRCEPCGVDVTSAEHLATHLAGVKHARRAVLAAADADTLAQFGPGGAFARTAFAKWRCLPCAADMCVTAVRAHVAGAKHRTRMHAGGGGGGARRASPRLSLRLGAGPGAPQSQPRPPLNAAAKEFRPAGAAAAPCAWQAAVAAVAAAPPPPPRASAAAASRASSAREFPCAVCPVVCNSPQNLADHLRSVGHERTVRAAREHSARVAAARARHTAVTPPPRGSPPREDTSPAADAAPRGGRLASGAGASEGAAAAGLSLQRVCAVEIAPVGGSPQSSALAFVPAASKLAWRIDRTPLTLAPSSAAPSGSTGAKPGAPAQLKASPLRAPPRVGKGDTVPTGAASKEGSTAALMNCDGPATENERQSSVAAENVEEVKENTGKLVGSIQKLSESQEDELLKSADISRMSTENAKKGPENAEMSDETKKCANPTAVEEQTGGTRPLNDSAHMVDTVGETAGDVNRTPERSHIEESSKVSSETAVLTEPDNAGKLPDSSKGSSDSVFVPKKARTSSSLVESSKAIVKPRAKPEDGSKDPVMEVAKAIGTHPLDVGGTLTQTLGLPNTSTQLQAPGKYQNTEMPEVCKENSTPMPISASAMVEDEPKPSHVRASAPLDEMEEELEPGQIVEHLNCVVPKVSDPSEVGSVPMEDVQVVGAIVKAALPTASETPTSAINGAATASQSGSTLSKKTKSKGSSSRSVASEQDLLQWYCDLCKVQCNANVPFQGHLSSSKHFKVLQAASGLDTSSAEHNGRDFGGGQVTGRALSPPAPGGSRKNSPPRKKKKCTTDDAYPMDLVCTVCTVCNVRCDAEIPFQEHLRSSKHLRKLENVREADSTCAYPEHGFHAATSRMAPVELIAKPATTEMNPLGQKWDGVACVICDVVCEDQEKYGLHLHSDEHAKRLQGQVPDVPQ